MRLITLLVCLTATLLPATLALAGQRPGDEEWASHLHRGVVVRVAGNSVTVRGTDGKQFPAYTNDATVVIFRGKQISLKDLEPGLKIIIHPGKIANLAHKIVVVDDFKDESKGDK